MKVFIAPNNMFIQELKEFGLSEKEAAVYLALLELEFGTVQEIAKVAQVNRSSAYVVLESLKKRGLVSITGGKKVQKFVAASPERLVRIAEEEAKQKISVRHKINAILPDLKTLFAGSKQKPTVRIFEGKEGLITMFEETLRCREKLMRVSSSASAIQKAFPDYLPSYVKKRMQLGIKMRGIHPHEPVAVWLRENIAKGFDDIRLIPKEKWTFNADFAIYDNTISYMIEDTLIGITIEDAAVADGMKKMFDLAFEEATRLDIPDIKLPEKPNKSRKIKQESLQ